MRILIAGIGNIFHGDDGFGCEVIRELQRAQLPPEVTVIDFGIRSYDLAYALTDKYDLSILVDAVSRGDKPGTVYLLEPMIEALGPATADAHSLNPVAVLQMACSIGTLGEKLLLVGCEPSILENENGQFELSQPVQNAVPEAAMLIRHLIQENLAKKRTLNSLFK